MWTKVASSNPAIENSSFYFKPVPNLNLNPYLNHSELMPKLNPNLQNVEVMHKLNIEHFEKLNL
jgi:hypothetical protein